MVSRRDVERSEQRSRRLCLPVGMPVFPDTRRFPCLSVPCHIPLLSAHQYL
ncbi:MAG: hypothetical protein [Podoviridae sp. ctQNx1]|nr:MAG: hypothetical protein [Podoviridae sp. ctQNx1]